MPLQHLQKDLCLAIGIGDQLEQPLPVTAAANEVSALVSQAWTFERVTWLFSVSSLTAANMHGVISYCQLSVRLSRDTLQKGAV